MDYNNDLEIQTLMCFRNVRDYYHFKKLIYFWLHWVFVAARGLSLVVGSGGYSLLQCVGFSCCGTQALGVRASVVVAHGALERRLSSCGARA